MFRKNRQRIVSMVFLAAILAAGITVSARQEKTAEKPAATAQAAKPGAAEMDRLKFYLGEWDYTESYPNGAKNTGVYTSKLGPGGNSLINSFHSQGPVGDFEGLMVMTWDAREKAYKAYVFGTDFPGAGEIHLGRKNIPASGSDASDRLGQFVCVPHFRTAHPRILVLRFVARE